MHTKIQEWAKALQDKFSFVELRESFPGVGRNKLRSGLNKLVADGIVSRLEPEGRFGQQYLLKREYMFPSS